NSYIWLKEEERLQLRRVLPLMHGTVSVSREVAAYARSWFAIDPSRNVIIPNGTTLNTPPANGLDGFRWDGPKPKADEFTFLNVGTLNRLKAKDPLLRAFARIVDESSDVHLTMVGGPADARFYDEIVSLRKELRLEARVALVPGMDRKNVLEMMMNYNCF